MFIFQNEVKIYHIFSQLFTEDEDFKETVNKRKGETICTVAYRSNYTCFPALVRIGRIEFEDVFSIVDSSFMPCGVECDQYSVIGEVLDVVVEKNVYTNEEVYIMTLDCNDMTFDVAINRFDLIGEPAIGRRFKGQIWLQGKVEFQG